MGIGSLDIVSFKQNIQEVVLKPAHAACAGIEWQHVVVAHIIQATVVAQGQHQ